MDVITFQHDGKTFNCKRESSPGTPDLLWWWFSVSGDSQRYAGFQSKSGDTEASVRRGILEHYANVLAIRERPRLTRPSWTDRRPAAVAAAAAAAATKPPETPAKS